MSHTKTNRWVELHSSAEGRLREREWLPHEFMFRKYPTRVLGMGGKESSGFEWVPSSKLPQLLIHSHLTVLVTVWLN